jgi:glutamyl-tRNA reductase
MNFVGCQLELDAPPQRETIVAQLRQSPEPLLVLDTCQRLETFGFDIPSIEPARVARTWSDRDAFERLARIAAGLESRIIGELEVIGQVRAAYRHFRETSGARESALDRIFQDAIALARYARRESGIDRKLTSLSGIAARTLLDRVPAGAHLAVLGAGSLAAATARYLTKRGNCPIRIASRCPQNAVTLAVQLGGFGVGLDDLAHLFHGVSGIVTATAAPHPLVYPRHLAEAARPLVIVDLGVPPDCHPDVASLPGVTYIGLADIEAQAQVNTDDRRRRAEIAARLIRDGAQAWIPRV